MQYTIFSQQITPRAENIVSAWQSDLAGYALKIK